MWPTRLAAKWLRGQEREARGARRELRWVAMLGRSWPAESTLPCVCCRKYDQGVVPAGNKVPNRMMHPVRVQEGRLGRPPPG